MQEYQIILTREAIYDVTDIAEYIEEKFGKERADRFQDEIQNKIRQLNDMSAAFPKTQLFYRNYAIHKKLFPPSNRYLNLINIRMGCHRKLQKSDQHDILISQVCDVEWRLR